MRQLSNLPLVKLVYENNDYQTQADGALDPKQSSSVNVLTEKPLKNCPLLIIFTRTKKEKKRKVYIFTREQPENIF